MLLLVIIGPVLHEDRFNKSFPPFRIDACLRRDEKSPLRRPSSLKSNLHGLSSTIDPLERVLYANIVSQQKDERSKNSRFKINKKNTYVEGIKKKGNSDMIFEKNIVLTEDF